MRYLVTSPRFEPFFTEWFTVENNLADDMVVFDMHLNKYIKKGIEWTEIETDHL